MIHDPLLFIDKLELAAKDRALTKKEWYRLRSDMNSAVCLLMSYQSLLMTSRAFYSYADSQLDFVKTFLGSHPHDGDLAHIENFSLEKYIG